MYSDRDSEIDLIGRMRRDEVTCGRIEKDRATSSQTLRVREQRAKVGCSIDASAYCVVTVTVSGVWKDGDVTPLQL
jgi:hypothetical protein